MYSSNSPRNEDVRGVEVQIPPTINIDTGVEYSVLGADRLIPGTL